MRRKQLLGKTITLKVKYHDFKQITRSSTINEYTADSKRIYREILQLVGKTGAGQKPIRLLGVSLSGFKLENDSKKQFLFPEMQTGRKRKKINRALDAIYHNLYFKIHQRAPTSSFQSNSNQSCLAKTSPQILKIVKLSRFKYLFTIEFMQS